MPRVAVCFRLEDRRDLVERLCDRLAEDLGAGQVVCVGNTPENTVECDVLVVIIGPNWLTALDGSSSPLEDARDTVRAQLEAALSAGAMVIPLFVDGAKMPESEKLPARLAQLSFQNGMPLRSDPYFRNDAMTVLKTIRDAPSRPIEFAQKNKGIAMLARGRNGALAALVITLVCGLLSFLLSFHTALPLLFAISFLAWPLTWFVVWFWKRRSDAALIGCFLLPLVFVGVTAVSCCMALIPWGCFVAAKSMAGVPVEKDDGSLVDGRLLYESICAFQVGLAGAVLGAATSAMRVVSRFSSGVTIRYPRWAVVLGGMIGALIGFLATAALCEALCVAPPPDPSGKDPAEQLLLKLYIFFSVLLLWLFCGFMTTAVDKTAQPFRL
jgi:hypothetical protein